MATDTQAPMLTHRLLLHPWLWRAIFYPLVGFILYLATTPKAYPIPASANDKINHFLAFVALAVLLRLAHRHLPLLWTIVFLAAFGLLIEGVQYYLPYRDFSLLDWGADMAGAGVGLIIIETIHRLSTPCCQRTASK